MAAGGMGAMGYCGMAACFIASPLHLFGLRRITWRAPHRLFRAACKLAIIKLAVVVMRHASHHKLEARGLHEAAAGGSMTRIVAAGIFMLSPAAEIAHRSSERRAVSYSIGAAWRALRSSGRLRPSCF